MHGKRGIVEFGLGRRLVVEMIEAVGAPRQCRGQPGRPDMAHAGRNVANADANPPVVASLTVIAERITGAHWSGPRFFGLTKRTGASVSAEAGD